jgi:hypothetical protein
MVNGGAPIENWSHSSIALKKIEIIISYNLIKLVTMRLSQTDEGNVSYVKGSKIVVRNADPSITADTGSASDQGCSVPS